MRAYTDHAMDTAASHIQIAQNCIAAADPMAHIGDQLRQYPQIEAVVNDLMPRVHLFMEGVAELHQAINRSLIARAADAAQGGNYLDASSVEEALDLPMVQSAMAKLKQASELDSLLDAVEAAITDENILNEIKSWCAAVGEPVDYDEIRAAIQCVNVDNTDWYQTINEAVNVLKTHPSTQHLSQTHAAVEHCQSEFGDILENIKAGTQRSVQMIDNLLAELSASA